MQDLPSWLASIGFPSEISLDGKIHRVARGGKKDVGWYVGWQEPFRCIVAGDWRTGERYQFAEKTPREMTVKERQNLRRRMDESRVAAQVERERGWELAKLRALSTLNAAWSMGKTPYLTRKGVGLWGGAKISGEEVLVPSVDFTGELWGLQRILPDGTKLFLPGQKAEGTFHKIPGRGEQIYLCEGYATGASIHMATGATVFCAWSAGNLPAVAEGVKRAHPEAELVIAGDNDTWTEGNPGARAAGRAAALSGARAVLPAFASLEGRPTDFNDLHVREGLDALPPQLLGATPMAEVTSIDEARKKRAKKEKGDKGPSRLEIYREILSAMDGAPGPLPAFPERFYVLQAPNGVRSILKLLDDGVVAEVGEKYVKGAVLRYCARELAGLPEYQLVPRQASEVVEMWTYEASPIERPKAVRWLEEDGLCYRRLPWSCAGGATPLFDEFLSRCSNAEALKAWVGSLMIDGTDRQQYVWMYGKGLDGKSAFARFLAWCFGEAAISLNVPKDSGNQFWSKRLLNKRFGYFPDCNKYGFPASGEFKALTGGDRIAVEPKGGDAYDAELVTKFLFLSNDRPGISSENADMRRLLHVEVQGIDGEPDPAYETRMRDEGGAFLSNCMALYVERYPDGGAVKTDRTEMDEWARTMEEDYHAFLERNFDLIKAPSGRSFTEEQKKCFVTSVEMQERRNASRMSKVEWLSFLAWLERTHGVKSGVLNINGSSSRRYAGLRAKPAGNFYSG